MIYVFGDSFSENYKNPREGIDISSYIWEYIKYLGRDSVMYIDLLSEYFNQPIDNYSIGGISNEHIFMLFMENYSKIKEDDVVVFGWTDISRIMIPINLDGSYTWRSNIYPNDFLSEKTCDEMRVMYNHELYKNKLLGTIKFIDEILSNNITIHWTWSPIPKDYPFTIRKETNGAVDDSHYSEEGHRVLFDEIIQQLQVNKHVRINL